MRSRTACAALLLGAPMAAPACGGDEAEPRDVPGLVVARREAPRPIDVRRAVSDVTELVRAARSSQAAAAAALGAHHLEVRTTIEVRDGAQVVEQLGDTAVVDLAADGDFHAALDNTRNYGRDVYFIDGAMYLRPRHGKFHRRPPVDDGEPVRVRDEIAGSLGAYLELAAPGLVVGDGGARKVAGRDAWVVTLAAGDGPEPTGLTAQQGWRREAVVSRVAGEVALDAASGVPLAGKLEAVVAFQRGGHHFEMTLSVQHAVSAIGAVAPQAAPAADQIVAVVVARELSEREQLLEGIASPAARAPTPDNPTGAASATAPAPR